MCPKVKDMGSFQHPVSEMGHKIKFKMGVKFATLYCREFTLCFAINHEHRR